MGNKQIIIFKSFLIIGSIFLSLFILMFFSGIALDYQSIIFTTLFLSLGFLSIVSGIIGLLLIPKIISNTEDSRTRKFNFLRPTAMKVIIFIFLIIGGVCATDGGLLYIIIKPNLFFLFIVLVPLYLLSCLINSFLSYLQK